MHEVLQEDEKGWYYRLDENLKRSATAYPSGTASCSTTVAIDMTGANSFRERLSKESGVRVGASSLIIKAAAIALPDFPVLCGTWETMDKIRCPDPEEIDIVGPIRIADTIGFFFIGKANKKTLLQIETELGAQVKELKSRPANEAVYPEWQSSPSFCISNVGTLGPIEEATGPVAWFATSILGICSILEKPVVKQGQIVICPVMNAVLCWDHRAMMGNTSAEFLIRFKTGLEQPDTYLI